MKRALLALALAVLPTRGLAAPGYAIVVGNNASPVEDPSLAPLRFADDDAVRYAAVLGRVVSQVHLLTVLDAQSQRHHPGVAARTRPPTFDALMAAVEDVKARLQVAPGPVYLAFSGHGSNDRQGEPFLALLDRGLTRAALFERVLPALAGAPQVHLIIDACNAGAVVGARGPFDGAKGAQSVPVAPEVRAQVVAARSLARFPNVGAIIATSAGQASHEWSRIESGVFTHELLSGLVGPADINGDLKVEYSELQAFVGAANTRVSDPRARPDVRALPPAQDHKTPLFSFEALSGPFLRGDLAALGHFYIELRGGRRYLDANLGEGRPVTILLPAQTEGFVRAELKEAALPATADGVIDLDDLDFRAVRLASRGSLDESLREDLFAAPFDVAYYRGFVDSRGLVSADLSVAAVTPLAERWTWKEKAAVGLFAVSGAAAVSAAITGALAADTKRQFEATTVQRRASELSGRYDSLLAATWVGAAVAVAAAGSGLGLWVSAAPATLEDPSPTGAAVGISGTF